MPEIKSFDPIQHTLRLPEGTIKLSPQQTRYLLILQSNPEGVSSRELDQLMVIDRHEPPFIHLGKAIASSTYKLIANSFSPEMADSLIVREPLPDGGKSTLHRLVRPLQLEVGKYGLHEEENYYYMGSNEIDQSWDTIDLATHILSTPQRDIPIIRTARDQAYTQLSFRGEVLDLNTLTLLTNLALGTNHAVVKAYEQARILSEATSNIKLHELRRPITTHIETAAKITGVIHKPGHRRIHN